MTIPGLIIIVLIGSCIPFATKSSSIKNQEDAAVSANIDSTIQASDILYRFDFGPGKVETGYYPVLSNTVFSTERGFGFLDSSTISAIDRGGDDALRSDFCTSAQPFVFAVAVPEGNYNVSIIFGDRQGESMATVKAESRRLMLEKIHAKPGEFLSSMFTTNVRFPDINDIEKVQFKPRENDHPNWDRLLTIEFNDVRPCVCAIEIARAKDAIAVFLAGNSTVTDQKEEPWAAWGQMLPRFFKAGKVAIANHAESGESLKSFIAENRLKKIESVMKSGDYLFIQFGHNDQKPQNSVYVEPFSGYKEYLKFYIDTARKHGAIPVLITPMHRRKFDGNGEIINTHGDYPQAMRQVAQEENVALIDLHKMSEIFYKALGAEGSKKAFVHYPAGTFPDQNEALKDDSHFNNYGAYQLAKCIITGIKANNLDIAKYLVDDLPLFEPGHPDPFEYWNLPVSPAQVTAFIKPAGN